MRAMQKTEIKKSVTYRFGDKREVLKSKKCVNAIIQAQKGITMALRDFFEIKLKTVIDV